MGLAVASVWVAAAPAGGADWPQWRGPNRDGVTTERSNFPLGWPPKRLWGRNVGVGCTSPILAGGRVYVMGWHADGGRRKSVGTDTVTCLDARTGKEQWKQSYRCRYQGRFRAGDTGQYGGPCSTPAFDAKTGLLYTLSVDGDLRCWDTAKDGRSVWAKNLYDAFKVRRRPNVGGGLRDFGFTSSPLILADHLIVEVGAEAGTVMAFDKAAGRRRWSSALTGPAGHTSGPTPMTVSGVPCLATLTLTKLVVVRSDAAGAGKTLAEYPWRTDYACSIATPATAGSRVVLTSGYNQRKALRVDVWPKGVRKVWTSKGYALVSSPVIHDGCVYLVDRDLKCVDLATGRLKWRGGRYGHGSCLITGDGKVLVFGQGTLALVATGGTRYRELARVAKVVPKTCYPHVALAGGVICCKDRAGNMVCFSIRGGSGDSASRPTPATRSAS